MKTTKTERGFERIIFTDRYEKPCRMQKSSLADEHCIWLGISDAEPRIMCSDAIKLGLREETGTDADRGWCEYQIPEEVLLSTFMHLTQQMVKDLLPHLEKFAETGELS